MKKIIILAIVAVFAMSASAEVTTYFGGAADTIVNDWNDTTINQFDQVTVIFPSQELTISRYENVSEYPIDFRELGSKKVILTSPSIDEMTYVLTGYGMVEARIEGGEGTYEIDTISTVLFTEQLLQLDLHDILKANDTSSSDDE